jgi:hypothetical protein
MTAAFCKPRMDCRSKHQRYAASQARSDLTAEWNFARRFQDDDAVVEQFRINALDQMMAFDCGI